MLSLRIGLSDLSNGSTVEMAMPWLICGYENLIKVRCLRVIRLPMKCVRDDTSQVKRFDLADLLI